MPGFRLDYGNFFSSEYQKFHHYHRVLICIINVARFNYLTSKNIGNIPQHMRKNNLKKVFKSTTLCMH